MDIVSHVCYSVYMKPGIQPEQKGKEYEGM